ncbi:MAG: GIY-YIG nuclease family protein, partial [Flavobacteriales bacterium]|nr:GIY-YIG nuclease family protein [Flavobacteriales bacterium]
NRPKLFERFYPKNRGLRQTKVNNKLEGFILRLQPHLKTRNELTTYFTAFICKRYKTEEPYSVFNTYQDQQRSLFERLDYWTFDDTLKQELKGRNGVLNLKGHKGILYVPFAKVPSEEKSATEKKTTKTKNGKTKVSDEHYVYLMHNKHNNYYKIGRSIKPEYREKTLQAQEPDIALINKWIASAEVEKILHRKYKEKKMRGEWFKLTTDDIIEIREFMVTIIKATTTRKSK